MVHASLVHEVLDQPAEDAEKPCSVTTPSFAIAPGLWEIDLACKSDLKSPDNSFSGVVSLECLDASGKLVISPAQAIETYQSGVTNPATDIAGLRVILPRLLAMMRRRGKAKTQQSSAAYAGNPETVPSSTGGGGHFLVHKLEPKKDKTL